VDAAQPERKLRIRSDGTDHGTVIEVDGKPLADVVSVSWAIAARELARATIEIAGVPVDIDGRRFVVIDTRSDDRDE
jgi:hypothetical protein